MDNQQEEKHDKRLRDFGLILLGYGLSSPESRAHLFGIVEPSDFPKEISELLEAMRVVNRQVFSDWLVARGAWMENGERAIDAMAKSVRAHTRRVARNRLWFSIKGSSNSCPDDDEFLKEVEANISHYKKLMEREP